MKIRTILSWLMLVFIVLIVGLVKWIIYSIDNEGFWYKYGYSTIKICIVVTILIWLIKSIIYTICDIKEKRGSK